MVATSCVECGRKLTDSEICYCKYSGYCADCEHKKDERLADLKQCGEFY